MAWKQLIPTNLDDLCHGDTQASTILLILFYRAAHEDRTVMVNNSPVDIKRGECIVGSFELAKRLYLHKNENLRCYRKLVRLEKVHNLVKIRRHQYCSVVTILNYDKLTSFDNLNERPVKNWRKTDENKPTVEHDKHIKQEDKFFKNLEADTNATGHIHYGKLPPGHKVIKL